VFAHLCPAFEFHHPAVELRGGLLEPSNGDGRANSANFPLACQVQPRCPAQPLDALNRPDLLGLARREGVVRDVEGRRT